MVKPTPRPKSIPFSTGLWSSPRCSSAVALTWCWAIHRGIKCSLKTRVSFFGTRDHEVAEQPNMAARKRAIQRLATINPALHSEYESAVSQMNGVQKFIHASTRFPKTSYGRLNSAPLFARALPVPGLQYWESRNHRTNRHSNRFIQSVFLRRLSG